MNITVPILITYGLLAGAVIAAWFKPLHISERFTLPPWAVVFAASCAAGLVTDLLTWSAIAALACFAGLAWVAKGRKPGTLKAALLVAAGCMALALSLHKFAGFTNPSLVRDMRVGDAAPSFTHNLNFDTTAAGLILFAFFCAPARTRGQWRDAARQYPLILGAPLAVLAIGVCLRYVNIDFKIIAYTPIFFFSNLLFTCVVEETFFRGYIQQQFSVAMRRWRGGRHIAVAAAAFLFGVAHARGGPMLIGLATLAGLGYGYAYLRSQRIEAAIFTHFTLNALHFLAFTYPRNI